MKPDRYILNDKTPVPCPNLMRWALWMEEADRQVARDEIGWITISTVFLGLDHNWSGKTPLLFETMVFGGELHGYMLRASTWSEAVDNHNATLRLVLDKHPEHIS